MTTALQMDGMAETVPLPPPAPVSAMAQRNTPLLRSVKRMKSHLQQFFYYLFWSNTIIDLESVNRFVITIVKTLHFFYRLCPKLFRMSLQIKQFSRPYLITDQYILWWKKVKIDACYISASIDNFVFNIFAFILAVLLF